MWKHRPLYLAAVLASSLWISCTCGQSGGQPCSTTAQCPGGESCVQGICNLDNTGDGGHVLPDGGPAGTDGGGTTDGGASDGGTSDGGTVVNPCPTGSEPGCHIPSCPAGSTTTLTGKVYDPSGTVPLYNALVYIPNGTVQPFTPGLTCGGCGALTTGSPLVSTMTGPDGSFVLKDIPVAANIPLVFQIGRWRRQVQISIPDSMACKPNPLTDVNLLRMPRNQSEGDIPLMAITSASADPFECLLRKMGIADTEFTPPTSNGRIHYFLASGGIDLANGTAPAASTLWDNPNALAKYDVVILPCEGGEKLKTASETQNIIDYTGKGGRLFTTHYGYVWIAKAQQPFPSTANWQPDPNQNNNPPDPFTVKIDQSFPKGADFAQWLLNVGASSALGKLDLHEARRDVVSTVPGKATQWMSANLDGGSTPNTAPHLTFDTPVNPPQLPDGGTAPQCGRVVFSDFHVSTGARTKSGTFPAECKAEALTAQEKALVFMLFDLSSCVQQQPVAQCGREGQSCTSDTGCCPGSQLTCQGPGGPCTGGSDCTCAGTLR